MIDATPPTQPRLNHGVCAACGYHISGAPIAPGVAICPECGHVNPLHLPKPRDINRYHRRRAILRLLAIALLGALALTLLLMR